MTPTQFVKIDFRLIENPEFMDFVHSPAFSVYMYLQRHIWRSTRRRHSVDKVNDLLKEGYLVSALSLAAIAGGVGIGSKSTVSRLLGELVCRGVMRPVRTGRQSAFVLGTYHGSDETLFLDERYGAARQERPAPARPESPPESPRADRPAGADEPPGGCRGGQMRADADAVGAHGCEPRARTDASSEFAPMRAQSSHQRSPINRERNREGNREGNTRSARRHTPPSWGESPQPTWDWPDLGSADRRHQPLTPNDTHESKYEVIYVRY